MSNDNFPYNIWKDQVEVFYTSMISVSWQAFPYFLHAWESEYPQDVQDTNVTNEVQKSVCARWYHFHDLRAEIREPVVHSWRDFNQQPWSSFPLPLYFRLRCPDAFKRILSTVKFLFLDVLKYAAVSKNETGILGSIFLAMRTSVVQQDEKVTWAIWQREKDLKKMHPLS